jgi:hypothetical protein
MSGISIRYLLTLVAVVGFCIPVSWACSCGRSAPGTCPDIKKVGSSFVGKVIDIENPPDERRGADQSGTSRYRFRVDENISGVDVKELDVYSGRGGADCSCHFQLGDTYLVFPYRNNGRLFATICSDTRAVADAEPLLSELRARRDGKPYASIYGVLRKTQQPYTWTSSDGYDRPLTGVGVQLRGAKHILSTHTDENGVYRFYDVPADTYHFAATLPAGLELAQTILSAPQPPITLPENACYQQDINALPTGRIRGRVIGPDGTPLKNADVALFRDDRYTEDGMGWWEYQGKEKAHFEFEHVAPGRYVIVFHNSNEPDPDIPYSRTFYPASPDLKSAIPIVIGEGEQVLNADIHVSGGRPTRKLVVRVRWNENPTPDDVYLVVEASDHSRPLPEVLSPGVFRITLIRGVQYTISARQACGGNTSMPTGDRNTDPVAVDGSDDRTTGVSLSLQDEACKPHHWPD